MCYYQSLNILSKLVRPRSGIMALLFSLWVAAAARAQAPSALKIADLDGDGRSDCASLRLQDRIDGAYRYRVNIDLSDGVDSSFVVTSTQARFGLLMAAVDIDGDHDLDLVIRSAFDLRLIGVWINDGHGAFTEGDLADYPQSVGLQHNQVVETRHACYSAAELPRIAGSSSFLEPVRQRLSLSRVFAARLAFLAEPRLTADRGVSSLRGPPVSSHNS